MYFVPASNALKFVNLISSYQAAAKQMLSEDEEKKTKSFFTLRALLYVMGAYMGSQITGDKMDAYCKPKTSAREEGARKPTVCDSSRNELETSCLLSYKISILES